MPTNRDFAARKRTRDRPIWAATLEAKKGHAYVSPAAHPKKYSAVKSA